MVIFVGRYEIICWELETSIAETLKHPFGKTRLRFQNVQTLHMEKQWFQLDHYPKPCKNGKWSTVTPPQNKQTNISPETNIAPENRPLEKEIPIGNHHFQGLC